MSRDLKITGAVIVGISLVLIISSWRNDAPTNDEVAHIGSGYSYIEKHNMRLNAEHPPLVKDLAALPLLSLDINKDIFGLPTYWTGDIAAESQWGFGHILLYKLGNDADKILHTARLPMLLFFVLAAILLFKWLYDLYGSKAALTGLIIFAFSPTVLAHAGLVTTDMAATATILLATYLFLNYLRNQSRKNLVIAGLGFGIAAVAKFSSLLLVPFFLVLALLYGKLTKDQASRPTLRRLLYTILICVVGFVVVVTPLYYINIYNYLPEQQAKDTQIILHDLYGNSGFTKPIVWLSDKPILRIYGEYLLGIAIINQRVTAVGEIYFLNELKGSVGVSYFPVIYILKESLPWLILLALAIVLVFRKRNWEGNAISKFNYWARNNLVEFSALLWIVIYLGMTLNSNLKIGVRHLLPIYPFVIMLTLAQFAKIRDYSWKRIINFATPVLLTWIIIDAFVAFPHYIGYYNELAGGGSNGYKYAVDSNLDWGQDLKRFGQWADNNEVAKIEVDYFGWADPGYYLGDKFIPINSDKYKNSQDFKNRNQSGGWLAVSATTLFQRSYGAYEWLRPFQPTATVGNSIYIWHF